MGSALMEALCLGGRVVWEPEDRPTLRVPPEFSPTIRKNAEEVREILRRAVVFKEQAGVPGPVPFLYLPQAKETGPGCCFSCGESVPKDRIRCDLCQAAAWIALDMIPSDARDIDGSDTLG